MKEIKQVYRDHTGWREVNPFSNKNHGYYHFEQSIQYHQFPNAPDVAEGVVVEAYLQTQKIHPIDISKNWGWKNTDESIGELEKKHYVTRRIWVLSEQETREEQKLDITVEEAAKEYADASHYINCGSDRYSAFIAGANWQSQSTSQEVKELREALEEISNLEWPHAIGVKAVEIADNALKVKP